jgi:hypothetical protein
VLPTTQFIRRAAESGSVVNWTAPCRSAWTETKNRARLAGRQEAKVIEEEYAEFEKLAEAWRELRNDERG